ncbi:MAG: HAD-IIIA family hydrolase [candidate division KSB1 bacterium]|nr:HAD-IIIA family hydrolase [candidate division KSB1 bacterium]MDZ7400239.1 HAD-IIIA family hydrolase [candidate division KSB1 bacterium]
MVAKDTTLDQLKQKAKRIKLLLTDSDGVLTDGGVYYSDRGEELKRFNMRDGMGVARLRSLAGVEVGIVTGEFSASVKKRAEKLSIIEYHPGAIDKFAVLKEIMDRKNLTADEIAYIGDDTNDVDVMKRVGLSACPADAMVFAERVADYVCEAKGGHGAFREFAEFIIEAKNSD